MPGTDIARNVPSRERPAEHALQRGDRAIAWSQLGWWLHLGRRAERSAANYLKRGRTVEAVPKQVPLETGVLEFLRDSGKALILQYAVW